MSSIMKDNKFIAITSDNREFLVSIDLINNSTTLQKMYYSNIRNDLVKIKKVFKKPTSLYDSFYKGAENFLSN